MSDIIEHYGKVVVALLGALAAITLTVGVVKTVKSSTAAAVSNLSYTQYVADVNAEPDVVLGDSDEAGDTGDTE